jgi:hypothetical protein
MHRSRLGEEEEPVSAVVNLTHTHAASVVGTGLDGKWQVTVVVKATCVWERTGKAIATEPRPIAPTEEFAGEPATSGLLRASELLPMKAEVDLCSPCR